MESYIYISSIEFYVELRNNDFFYVVSEFVSDEWSVTSECVEDDGNMFITFYAEKNHVKIEIGYLSKSEF